MTKNKLFKEILKREGKKSSVKIGDMREIWNIMIDLTVKNISSGDKSLPICRLIMTEAFKRLAKAAHDKRKKK